MLTNENRKQKNWIEKKAKNATFSKQKQLQRNILSQMRKITFFSAYWDYQQNFFAKMRFGSGVGMGNRDFREMMFSTTWNNYMDVSLQHHSTWKCEIYEEKINDLPATGITDLFLFVWSITITSSLLPVLFVMLLLFFFFFVILVLIVTFLMKCHVCWIISHSWSSKWTWRHNKQKKITF